MPHPIVHAEIRSADPDATRKLGLSAITLEPGAVRRAGRRIRRRG